MAPRSSQWRSLRDDDDDDFDRFGVMDDGNLSALERLALEDTLTLSPPAVTAAVARVGTRSDGDDGRDVTAVASEDETRDDVDGERVDDGDSVDDISLGRWVFDACARDGSEDEASTSTTTSADGRDARRECNGCERDVAESARAARGSVRGDGDSPIRRTMRLRDFDDDEGSSVVGADEARDAVERARAFAAVAERRRTRMPSVVVPTSKAQFQQFARELIDEWLLKLDGVELPGVRTGASGEVSAHRVVIAVSKGVFLCDVLCAVLRACGSSLAEMLQRKIPSVTKSPLSRYPMRDSETACAYIRLALRTLRRDENFPERWLDAEVPLAAGDPTAVWGILADIRARFMPVTTALDIDCVEPPPRRDDARVEGRSPHIAVARNLTYDGADDAVEAIIEGKSTLAIPPANVRDAQVREWLRSLRLQVTRREEAALMLENPLRNGVLLSDVLTVVMGAPSLRRLERAPQNIRDAQFIVESALLRLRQLPFSSACVPPRLLASSDGILNGDCEHIFGLIWCLRALSMAGQFEDVRAASHVSAQPSPSRRRRAMLYSESLPYSPEHVALLQKSLAKWLCDIGVLHPRDVDGDLRALFTSLKDGVALCAVAEKLDGVRVVGVFKKPCTLATRESNVRKAVNRFLEVKNMSRRFLTRSEFDVEHITGILEDARACLDGVEPCRPHAPWIATQPYVPDEPGFGAPRSIERAAPDLRSDEYTAPWRKPWYDSATTKSAQLKVVHRHDARERTATAARRLITPKSPPKATMSPLDTNAESETPTAATHALAERIIDWLVIEKYWPNDEPRSCDEGPACRLADVVSRGVLLCRLVSTIDRSEIIGVERAPKTAAHRLHNVSLALRALRANARFPPARLWSPRALARADVATCVHLLNDVRAFLIKRRARATSHM